MKTPYAITILAPVIKPLKPSLISLKAYYRKEIVVNPLNVYVRESKHEYRFIVSLEKLRKVDEKKIVQGYRAGSTFRDWRGIKMRPIAIPAYGVIVDAMI